jgi:hypothetical protein
MPHQHRGWIGIARAGDEPHAGQSREIRELSAALFEGITITVTHGLVAGIDRIDTFADIDSILSGGWQFRFDRIKDMNKLDIAVTGELPDLALEFPIQPNEIAEQKRNAAGSGDSRQATEGMRRSAGIGLPLDLVPGLIDCNELH